MHIEAHQNRKLNSFDCVNRFWVDSDKLVIQLEPAYSWSNDCFMHTKNFNSFNDALAALRKFNKKA